MCAKYNTRHAAPAPGDALLPRRRKTGPRKPPRDYVAEQRTLDAIYARESGYWFSSSFVPVPASRSPAILVHKLMESWQYWMDEIGVEPGAPSLRAWGIIKLNRWLRDQGLELKVNRYGQTGLHGYVQVNPPPVPKFSEDFEI